MDRITKGTGQELQAEPGNKRPWIGVGLVLASALGFSSSIVIASVMIRQGVGVNTSNAVRFLVATMLLFLCQKAAGRPVALSPRERYAALGLGITVFVMGIGYLGATKYIPVSMAVLIFYTGPIFTLFVSRFTEQEPITIVRLAAAFIAFLGLSFALGIHPLSISEVRGVLSALSGAIGMAAFVTIGSLTIRDVDPQAVNLHSLFGGTVLFLLFLFFGADPARGLTAINLMGLCGSGVAIGFAYVAFYAGLKMIGPVKASMLLNTEPIFTITSAAFILGEKLSYIKFIGAGLVILGIILINCKFAGRPISSRTIAKGIKEE
jgi:drug/metabolite transporter (DMT)-like permease